MKPGDAVGWTTEDGTYYCGVVHQIRSGNAIVRCDDGVTREQRIAMSYRDIPRHRIRWWHIGLGAMVLGAMMWADDATSAVPSWCPAALARAPDSLAVLTACQDRGTPIEYQGVISGGSLDGLNTFRVVIQPIPDPIEPPIEPPPVIPPPVIPPPVAGGIPGVRPAPAWVAGMPVGAWVELPATNKLVDVNSSQAWGYATPDSGPWVGGSGRFNNIVTSWNGAAIARNLGDAGAYVIGPAGGHGAYGGSELYLFDLGTLTWGRKSEPYGTLGEFDSTPNWDGWFEDGSPIPAHTGDTVVVMEWGDQVWLGMTGIGEHVTGAPISGSLYQPIRAAMLDLRGDYTHTEFSSSWMWAPWTTPECAVMDLSACARGEYTGTAWDYNRSLLWTFPDPSTAVAGRLFALDPTGDSGVAGKVGAWQDWGPSPISGFNYMMAAADRARDLIVFTNFVSANPTQVWYFDPQAGADSGFVRLNIAQGNGPATPYKGSGWEYSEVTGCMMFYDTVSSARDVWRLCIDQAERPFTSATWTQVVSAGIVPEITEWGAWSRFRVARFALDGELVEVALLVSNTGTVPDTGNVYAVRLPGEVPIEPPIDPVDPVEPIDPPVETPPPIVDNCDWVGAPVVACHRFTDQASVDDVMLYSETSSAALWDDANNGVRLTVNEGAFGNTAGVVWLKYPPLEGDVWWRHRARISESFTRDPVVSKENIAYHAASCSANEVTQMFSVGFGGTYPSMYENCGAAGYYTTDPLDIGDNSNHDFQPGGDSACLRHGVYPSKPCWMMPADTWVTFTTHVDLIDRVTRVWAQSDGGPKTQILEFPTQTTVMLSAIQLGPYINSQPALADYTFWYQDIAISTEPL